jgi:S-adenosylmethionine synthetase
MDFCLESLEEKRCDRLDVEIVERKGLGHPDTICDELAEQLSLALMRHYRSACGEVLHFNVDKLLLAGGRSQPAFGGGRIVQPIDLFFAGRAVTEIDGKPVPIEEMLSELAAAWFNEHLPAIDPRGDLRLHNLVRPGSVDLAELFRRRGRGAPLANDTSCGVGFAPLSRLETVVYDVEAALRRAAKREQRAIGPDIKVMGLRRGRQIHLTVACALIGRFLENAASCLRAKEQIAAIARRAAEQRGAESIAVAVNTADDPGAGSFYLTVTGTSAEAGDDGEAGRGNRINGLITPCRPMTMESVAGKNPVTHVGKIYNIAATLIAQRLVGEVPGVAEAECLLVSEIGRPIDHPQMVKLSVRSGAAPDQHRNEIQRVVESELSRLPSMIEELAAGRLKVGRWPLREG